VANSKNLLGMILLEANIISERDVRRAVEEQKKSGGMFGEVLLKIGAATKEDVKWALAIQQGLPFVRLKDQYIDPEAVQLVPKSVAEKYRVVPFLKFEDGLTLVVADEPSDEEVGELEDILGTNIRFCLGMEEDIEQALGEIYEEGVAKSTSFSVETHIFDPHTYEEIQRDRSGYTLLLNLFERAAIEGAESIHFEPQGEEVVVRYKDEGGYKEVAKIVESWYPTVLNRLLSLAESVKQRGLARSGFLKIRVLDRTESFYVSTTQTTSGEAVIVSRLGKRMFPKGFEDVQAPKDDLEKVRNILQMPGRLVVFYGPNRSDKIAFLLPLLDGAGYLEKRVIYVGDREDMADLPALVVEPRRGDVSEALFAAASQKPDVLIAGSLEVGGLVPHVLSIVGRGTKVLSMVQFDRPGEVLEYLVEMAKSRVLLQRYLGGMFRIVAYQALCPLCREKYSLSRVEARELGMKGSSVLYKEVGCPACQYSGSVGMRFLFECLTDDVVAQAMAGYTKKRSFEKALEKIGFVPLRTRLERLLLEGELSVSEFKKIAGNRNGDGAR